MPVDGKLVAWSVHVAKTVSEQSNFFSDLFEHKKLGTDPFARIAVLRRKQKKAGRFKLRKQSPGIDLSSHAGSRVIFTLRKPLNAAKGDVIALTVPTWAAVLDVDVPRGNHWVASRVGNCNSENPDTVAASRPQQKVGSLRSYGCAYTARLTYWAYYVPKQAQKERKDKAV
jgi:hypothetical protein